jgi:hypothetical protein
MAETYWITFCVADSGNEERRYQALVAAIRRMTCDAWWTESVNYLLFRSEHAIDHIAGEVAAVIDTDTDLALLAKASAHEARAIGAVEDGLLYELMPYAQRYHPPSVPPAHPSESASPLA